MKPKPVSHKALNTFKFQSFVDKLKTTQVSIWKLILNKQENKNEFTSHFWSALTKWRDINLTLGFKVKYHYYECSIFINSKRGQSYSPSCRICKLKK